MTMLTTSCIGLLAAACLAIPAQSATPAGDRAETYAIARQFMRMQYELHDMKGAKSRFYSPDFIQHNQEIKNGVLGDPTGASADAGSALLDELTASLVGEVAAWRAGAA